MLSSNISRFIDWRSLTASSALSLFPLGCKEVRILTDRKENGVFVTGRILLDTPGIIPLYNPLFMSTVGICLASNQRANRTKLIGFTSEHYTLGDERSRFYGL